MITQILPNADAGQITVTSTASSLEELIAVAAGVAFKMPQDINALDLQVELGEIRYYLDGNTPTSSKGWLMSSLGVNIVQFTGETINKLRLISTGSDAIVNIQIGKSGING